MSLLAETLTLKYLGAIKQFQLIDDTFSTYVLTDNACMKLLLMKEQIPNNFASTMRSFPHKNQQRYDYRKFLGILIYLHHRKKVYSMQNLLQKCTIKNLPKKTAFFKHKEKGTKAMCEIMQK